jgi:NADPH-dependent 2,4-dienoyl-CoA reductase/sulfur reductase-like enzyme
MVEPPVEELKIAIIGGGPAGMEAALISAGRGHDVTLYEKDDVLGGQLNYSEIVSFKWPLRDFKNYLVRQINKSSVKVLLNTEATGEMLDKERYDVVLAALGSEPIVPPIPGVDGKNVFYAVDVYGKENLLADDIVVIGGGEVGVETGMHLAEKGYKVTLLEMQARLAPEATPVHYYSMFMEAVNKQKNFRYILNARCTGINKNGVDYLDDDGNGHEITAGCVVIAVGMKSRIDKTMELSSAGNSFYMIGDCKKAGNVQKAMRSAFSIASMI